MARQYERAPQHWLLRSLVGVPDELDVDGVLITGVYGTGKSSVAAEMPLRVVRLEVPLTEIARRLRADPTTGRRDDLREAARWLNDSIGVGIEDLSIANEGSIQNVATHIIDWLGWIP
jgi:hypothetical protein